MKYSNAVAPLLLITPLVLGAGPLAARVQQPNPLVAQAPRDPRAAEPAPTGTASLSGTVTVAGSGLPARKARVSLSGGELGRGRNVTTDETGRFVFAALPAGRYSLSASKPGHVTVLYGQRSPGPGRPGTPIQLADGQKLDVHLQIPRGGVITGTVLDERGEAVPGIPVRVLRHVIQGGQRTLQQAGNGSTDDRGMYRVYGLQPGEYAVAAIPRNNTNQIAQMEELRAEVEGMRARVQALAAVDAEAARALAERAAVGLEPVPTADDGVAGYAPVYYPGTTAPGSAAMVSIGVGEEKMGIDFSLQLVPIARIEGIVVTGAGEPAQNIQVSLVNVAQNVPGIGNSTARPDREGRFRLSNVAPGQYVLVARGTIGGPGRGGRAGQLAAELAGARGRAGAAQRPEPVRLWAMTDVMVDGRNITDLVLNLQPGMNVSGRLVFEGTTTVPSDLTRVRVTASPSDPVGASRQVASSVGGRVDASGRFTITGVTPGRYRITAAGAMQGWTLASAVVSGQDTLDVPIEVKPNENVSGAVLTFTDRPAEITGTIVNERGQPAPDYTIVVFPAEPHFWTPGSRRISSQRPGTDGRFTFRNLPPGEYRIAPMLDPEPGSWYDPALLQQLENQALSVPLGQGESKVQNLRVGGL